MGTIMELINMKNYKHGIRNRKFNKSPDKTGNIQHLPVLTKHHTKSLLGDKK